MNAVLLNVVNVSSHCIEEDRNLEHRRILSNMTLSKEKEELLYNIVNDLKQVDKVAAIVLGGSYAAGEATETSDLDIGIYYSENKPFSTNDIKLIAEKYSVNGKPTVTGFYEWGPWVNGGAWIETAYGNVDFVYRNVEHVNSIIERAKNGEWQNDFEQQPPYGFSSIIYLAETRSCVSLYDPNEIVAKLKTAVQTYPSKLKETVVKQSLWSAEFTIWHAEYFYRKQDAYNTIGCLTRAAKNIVTALFAINELYPMGDKRAIDILENSDIRPLHFKERIETLLCTNKQAMGDNINSLKKLFNETIKLTNGTYSPFYKLKSGQ